MEKLCATINETALALGIGRTKVYQLIASGQLESIKIGRRHLVMAASIRTLTEKCQ